MNATSFLLSQEEDTKKRILKDALSENKFREFYAASKILLDAPISNGGLASEVIDDIFQVHLDGITGQKR